MQNKFLTSCVKCYCLPKYVENSSLLIKAIKIKGISGAVYKLSANLKVSRPIPLTNTFYVIHAAGVNSNLVLSPLLSDSRVCEHQAAPANYDRYSK